MATHPSILACRIPWTEETGGLHRGHKPSETSERLTLFFTMDGTVAGKGTPSRARNWALV